MGAVKGAASRFYACFATDGPIPRAGDLLMNL